MTTDVLNLRVLNERNRVEQVKSPKHSNGFVNKSLEMNETERSNVSISTSINNVDTISLENDVIEIHQFTLADLDDYLEIYFDTLKTRLTHYVGDDDQLKEFRSAMKNRISSNRNSNEFENVLLGKIHDDVVAAVTLSFRNNSSSFPSTEVLRGPNSSCLTSIRRWIGRKAIYHVKNAEECYIEMIGVKNTYRNHGIGSAMLECVEHFAQQAGSRLITIHVQGEPLRNYFQRFDFQIDSSDNSAFWKSTFERENVKKMCKLILPIELNESFHESISN